MTKLSDRVAYLESRVRQMEIEMGRMEQDIAMLLRERNPHWPMRPDPHPIITVNPDDWSPIVRGRAPTLKGKEGRTYSKTGYGSK